MVVKTQQEGDLASVTPSGDQTVGELICHGVLECGIPNEEAKTRCLDISIALSAHIRYMHPKRNLGIDKPQPLISSPELDSTNCND